MAKAKINKRLDGKKKLVSLTSQMTEDLRRYCHEHRIKSESECIRQAIVHLIYDEYGDNTLKLSSLRDLRETLGEIKDMLSILFSYDRLMHMNLLAYHAEIPAEYKDAASQSATTRHEKFFESFRERLRDDPPFFERLLHNYVSGTLDD